VENVLTRISEIPPIELEVHELILFGGVVALGVVTVVLTFLLVRARRGMRRSERLERNGLAVSSPLRRLEQELAFIGDFIREFPQLLLEVQSQSEVRRIPSVLLSAIVRFFKAEQAVVLVRRKSTLTDPERNNRLVVAALASAERGLRVGTEVSFGEGQLGLAAETQQVLDRADLDRESSIGSGLNHTGPEFDVVAPMVIGDQTMGVIAFARPARVHPRQKEMLQMIAQLGALAWHNATTFRTVKFAAEVDELTGIFNKAALKLRQLVRDTVRADDIFGRFGGEEFLLIMPGRTQEEAYGAAESIRHRIAGYDFESGDHQPLGRVSVSGGVASFPADARDVVDLLLASDAALYRAKQGGRNRVERAEVGINPGA